MSKYIEDSTYVERKGMRGMTFDDFMNTIYIVLFTFVCGETIFSAFL